MNTRNLPLTHEMFEKFSQLRKNWEEIHNDGLKQLQSIHQILSKAPSKKNKESNEKNNTDILDPIFVFVLKNKEIDSLNEEIIEAKTLETTFKDLKQTQNNLLKAYDLMSKIIEKTKNLIEVSQLISEEQSYYTHGNKTIVTEIDIVNCLLGLYDMYSKEFNVKQSILTDVKYSMNLQILNNYIIIWSLQPYIDTQYLLECDSKYQFEKIPELDKGQIWLQKVSQASNK